MLRVVCRRETTNIVPSHDGAQGRWERPGRSNLGGREHPGTIRSGTAASPCSRQRRPTGSDPAARENT